MHTHTQTHKHAHTPHHLRDRDGRVPLRRPGVFSAERIQIVRLAPSTTLATASQVCRRKQVSTESQAEGRGPSTLPRPFLADFPSQASAVLTLKTCLRHLDRTPAASVVRRMRFPSGPSLEWDRAKRDGASQVDTVVTWKLTSVSPRDRKMCFE